MGGCRRPTEKHLSNLAAMKIALFPGSFDPITKGHVAVLLSALPLFDKIYVAIGVNANKKSLFPLERKKKWIQRCFKNEPKIEVVDYQNLTIDLCKELGANYIIRGICNTMDFQYEKDIAHANKQLNPNVETVFFATTIEHSHISSSMVRDIYAHHGDCSQFIPDCYDIFEE